MEDVVIAIAVEKLGSPEDVVKNISAPAGSPEVERVTVSAVPLVKVTYTCGVVPIPWTALAELGDTEMSKSKMGEGSTVSVYVTISSAGVSP